MISRTAYGGYSIDLKNPATGEEDPLLEAAYAMAQKVHQGQPRWDGRPYIAHPELVYFLLNYFRDYQVVFTRNNPVPLDTPITRAVLAIALLHDVREDNDTYRLNPDLFVKDLTDLVKERLVARGLPTDPLPEDIQEDIATVAEGVDKLTYRKTTGSMTKRVSLPEDVRRFPSHLKIIKIMDQAASMIDDLGKTPEQMRRKISTSSGEHRTLDKVIEAKNRAKAVADNGETPAGWKYSFFFDLIYEYLDAYLMALRRNSKNNSRDIQENFDLENILELAAERLVKMQDDPDIKRQSFRIRHPGQEIFWEEFFNEEMEGRFNYLLGVSFGTGNLNDVDRVPHGAQPRVTSCRIAFSTNENDNVHRIADDFIRRLEKKLHVHGDHELGESDGAEGTQGHFERRQLQMDRMEAATSAAGLPGAVYDAGLLSNDALHEGTQIIPETDEKINFPFLDIHFTKPIRRRDFMSVLRDVGIMDAHTAQTLENLLRNPRSVGTGKGGSTFRAER